MLCINIFLFKLPTFSTNKTHFSKKRSQILAMSMYQGTRIRKVVTASLAMAFQLLLRNVEKEKKN